MNKKIIITIILGTTVLIGSLIWLDQPVAKQNSQENSPVSLLKSDAMLFDFGTISMAKGNISHEFTITNDSDQPVNIRKIYTSCMCTTAKFKFGQETYGTFGMPGHGISALTATDITLNPGESGVLEVIYDPNAHGPGGVGSIDRFVYLEDKNDSQLELEIKAVVTP